jgi:exosortase/archaeosortase family protein
MGAIEVDGKKYEFTWLSLVLLAVGAPLIGLAIYYASDYTWLHGVTSRITTVTLSWISGLPFETQYNATWNYYYITVPDMIGGTLDNIRFTTYCTGIQAIATYAGLAIATPHSLDKTTSRDIWVRKGKTLLLVSALFYVINVMRMWLQLWLYHRGWEWEDVHYPISAASSFIAIGAIMVMHKYTPEFIMSLIWASDEIRAMLKANKASGDQALPTEERTPDEVLPPAGAEVDAEQVPDANGNSND